MPTAMSMCVLLQQLGPYKFHELSVSDVNQTSSISKMRSGKPLEAA